MEIFLDMNSEWILIEKFDEKQDIHGFKIIYQLQKKNTNNTMVKQNDILTDQKKYHH